MRAKHNHVFDQETMPRRLVDGNRNGSFDHLIFRENVDRFFVFLGYRIIDFGNRKILIKLRNLALQICHKASFSRKEILPSHVRNFVRISITSASLEATLSTPFSKDQLCVGVSKNRRKIISFFEKNYSVRNRKNRSIF